MVLWGTVSLCWNNQSCPNKDAPADCRGSKVWCEQLLPPLWMLYCSLKSSCAGGVGGWKMASLHPLISGEGNWWPLLLRKPSKKNEQSLLLWPRPPSDPCPQIDFLVVESVLMPIYMCSRDETSPGVLILFRHLNSSPLNSFTPPHFGAFLFLFLV